MKNKIEYIIVPILEEPVKNQYHYRTLTKNITSYVPSLLTIDHYVIGQLLAPNYIQIKILNGKYHNFNDVQIEVDKLNKLI